MAYIANKPVRFDRTYAIGEIIPDEVIDPKMTRKLTEMGRILCVDIPAQGGGAENDNAPPPDDTEGGAENTSVHAQERAYGGAENESGMNAHMEEEPGREDAESGTEGIAEEAVITSEGGEDTEPTEPDECGEFVCPECGRTFGSKNALSAHSRSHKD